jgi:hypothetical protein
MSTNLEPYSDMQIIKIGEILDKPIIVLDYKIVPGHTKPGGKIGHKEDYVNRHIEILIKFDNKEFKIKTDSLNFEKQLAKYEKKIPAETDIFKSKHGMWFSPFTHINVKPKLT